MNLGVALKSENSTDFGLNHKKIRNFCKKLMGPTCPQAEGFILGVGAKIFTIAGPVILYGISAGAVYGIIYWVISMI